MSAAVICEPYMRNREASWGSSGEARERSVGGKAASRAAFGSVADVDNDEDDELAEAIGREGVIGIGIFQSYR